MGKFPEVSSGVEPLYTVLQTAASPLGHDTESDAKLLNITGFQNLIVNSFLQSFSGNQDKHMSCSLFQ